MADSIRVINHNFHSFLDCGNRIYVINGIDKVPSKTSKTIYDDHAVLTILSNSSYDFEAFIVGGKFHNVSPFDKSIMYQVKFLINSFLSN